MFVGLGTGSTREFPANPVNMELCAGQSNADEAVLGDTVITMAAEGIANPAYSEAPQPGKAFTNWYNSGGAQEFTINTDPTIAVVTLVQDGSGNATLTGGAGAFNQYDNKVKIVIEDSTTPEWNGVYRNTTANPTNVLTFLVPDTHAVTATGTITVRRAGFWEAFQSDIETFTDAGEHVNITHFHWMQGNGNADSATVAQYAFFQEFIKYIKTNIHTILGTLPSVTIDRNFAISVGLTGQQFDQVDDNLHRLRRYQIDACRYLDYAYFAETIDYRRDDGVHIHTSELQAEKSRARSAAINKRNITNLTSI